MPFRKGHKPYFRPPKGNKWGKKFQKGHPSYLTEESKKKIGDYWRGRKRKQFTKEHRVKMSTAQIKRWDKVGRKKYRDKDRTKEYRYIRWRTALFSRDNFTCQVCRKVGVYLEAHHIKSWIKYPELRYEISNGITFCKECHRLFHKKYTKLNNTREQLNEYLQ